MHVSAYSLKALAMAALPLMDGGGAIVGLDFDASVAWPAYDWMGVAKAGLESCARYLARDLGPRGIRVNLVAAGPIAPWRPSSIPGFADFEEAVAKRAPLGGTSPTPAGRARLRRAAVRLVPGHHRRDRPRPTAAPTRLGDERPELPSAISPPSGCRFRTRARLQRTGARRRSRCCASSGPAASQPAIFR